MSSGTLAIEGLSVGDSIGGGNGAGDAKTSSYPRVKEEPLNMTEGLLSEDNKGECDQAKDGNPKQDTLTEMYNEDFGRGTLGKTRMEGGRGEEQVRESFQKVYEQLKSELLQDPAFEYCPVSRQWIQHMLDYNVPGGKMSRGLSVVETYGLLKHVKELSENDFFLASVLGWCVQWVVACALVLDDIMDDSYTRRGRTCWYRLPNVGMIAINDGILLWNHINRILKNHFRNQPCYVDLLDLFNEVEFQTTSGEMIDLMTTIEEGKDLSKFTLELQQRISRFKTAYGTFYLPFACALLMLGEKPDDYTNVKDILLEMGIYFQVQDDYLDCFGDPKKVGKIGSDIQEFKCSWLVVKALELCNEEQKQVLCDNYGKGDPTNVAIVKSLYNDLNLQEIFADYEIEVYGKLVDRIETLPSKAVQSVLKSYLGKIYHRKK